MTTVINNPGGSDNSGSGMGLIIGVIIALGLIALFIFYGLPALRNNGNGGAIDVNVKLPAVENGGGVTP